MKRFYLLLLIPLVASAVEDVTNKQGDGAYTKGGWSVIVPAPTRYVKIKEPEPSAPAEAPVKEAPTKAQPVVEQVAVVKRPLAGPTQHKVHFPAHYVTHQTWTKFYQAKDKKTGAIGYYYIGPLSKDPVLLTPKNWSTYIKPIVTKEYVPEHDEIKVY